MDSKITIVTPAFNAHELILVAARSVLAQTYPHWTHLIIADDGADYEAVLREAGLLDPRITFISTPKPRCGSTFARNQAFDQVETDYVTLLDADDFFAPSKLERVIAALESHPIVATSLDVQSADYRHLRSVGIGPDAFLTAGQHKWRSISMDSMVSWDRRKVDARYDTELPNMTDLDFLMGLFRRSTGAYYLGEPLHGYVKVSTSMSNGAGFTERMIYSKRLLLERIGTGFYPMPSGADPEGIAKFLEISLEAEALYPAALTEEPSLLFETHIERLIGQRR